MQLLHRFHRNISDVVLPERFNNPFYYQPHRLCSVAADEVRAFLLCDEAVAADAAKGKMMGVLAVLDAEGVPGYLAAFSGLLAGSNRVAGFVPPVFDFLSPEGYFKQEELRISRLNADIDKIEREELCVATAAVDELKHSMEHELAVMREDMDVAKKRRDALRADGTLSENENAALVRESQFQKAEYRRLAARWRQKIAESMERAAPLHARVAAMKSERMRRSAALQEWLFANFKVLNARGESKDLLAIFKDHRGALPPAGSGECAAPKLLQYAYMQGYTPLAMAEFWVGASPHGEVRLDGNFYESCRSKCGPILSYMLQGLDVEENALEKGGDVDSVAVLYEDDFLILVNKPPGVLSVPGIVGGTSVQQWLRESYLHSNGVYVVHRLDMATSGLLVAAKSMDIYRKMQQMFAMRQIEKEYTALLHGVPRVSCGTIELPLSADYDNRPRQKVDYEGGKHAVTHYKVLRVLDYEGNACALTSLVPVTGRTHQLRVHAACRDGLGTPIVGDALYGAKEKRLMLHASRISFVHPVTGETIVVESPPDFGV